MKKLGRSFKIGLFFFSLILTWLVIAPLLAHLLIVDKPIEKADAIWILGGSGTYRERTQLAAEFYQKGVSQKIYLVNDGEFGGWNKVEQRNLPFYEMSKRELIAQGVAEKDIEILPENVTGTNYEADLFAKVAKENNLNSIMLVTSAYHSRRTLWTFQEAVAKNNLSVEIGIESPQVGIQTPSKFTWWLSRKGWMFVGGEYVKFVYYWLSY